MPSTLTPELDQQAIDIIRGLAMDAPLKAKSGHQGTAMALAPLGHVRFSRIMRHDPKHPQWPDRDGFNLANAYAAETITTTAGANFQQPTAIMAPRTARIGFRLIW